MMKIIYQSSQIFLASYNAVNLITSTNVILRNVELTDINSN